MPTGVYIRTKEHNRKISESHIGKYPSSETIRRISKALQGRIFSKDHRENLSKSFKEKFKDKRNHPNFGKHLSEETRKKISEAQKGRHYPKRSQAQLGRHASLATRKKLSEIHKRELNSNWKGGVSSENEIIRGSVGYRLWRNKVFKHDNYTDQKSGVKGVYLVAHHILNFADYPELRFVVDNGITLSREAHDEFHKIYGKQHNTLKQLEEFLGRKLSTKLT